MKSLKVFKEFLSIEKERQLATKELSQILGIDVSFSDKEVIKNAQEETIKHIKKNLVKELNNMVK